MIHDPCPDCDATAELRDGQWIHRHYPGCRRTAMSDQHLAPVCPHCGRQHACQHTQGPVATCRHAGFIVQGSVGHHARDREDYLTDEIAAVEEQREWWKKLAMEALGEIRRLRHGS